LFAKKNKIKPDIIINSPETIKNIEDYKELKKKIRNCNKITRNELDIISRLPRENLIELINIYNLHIGNFALFNEFHSVINTNNC